MDCKNCKHYKQLRDPEWYLCTIKDEWFEHGSVSKCEYYNPLSPLEQAFRLIESGVSMLENITKKDTLTLTFSKKGKQWKIEIEDFMFHYQTGNSKRSGFKYQK